MSTKTRVPNKVGWALEDIVALGHEARQNIDKALDRAETKVMDPVLLIALGRVSSAIARIDVKAREARNGEYSDGHCN